MRIARNDLHHAFNHPHYHDTLRGRFPFYDRLAETDKEKFVKRLRHFAKARDFFHIGLDPSPEVPVLISAAAVQLTFGLRRYRLPYLPIFIYTAKPSASGMSPTVLLAMWPNRAPCIFPGNISWLAMAITPINRM